MFVYTFFLILILFIIFIFFLFSVDLLIVIDNLLLVQILIVFSKRVTIYWVVWSSSNYRAVALYSALFVSTDITYDTHDWSNGRHWTRTMRRNVMLCLISSFCLSIKVFWVLTKAIPTTNEGPWFWLNIYKLLCSYYNRNTWTMVKVCSHYGSNPLVVVQPRISLISHWIIIGQARY